MPRLTSCLISLVLCSCATSSVTLAPGLSPALNEYFSERWLPSATQAQDVYKKLMQERAGLRSVKTATVVLASSKPEADKVVASQTDAFVTTLNSSFPDVLIVRTIVDPVRASAGLLFAESDRQAGKRSPAWLVRGVSTQIALDVLRMQNGLNSLTERILLSDLEVELRSTKTYASVADLLRRQADGDTKAAAFLNIADFMGETLKLRAGEAFYRALASYIRLLEAGNSPEQAFQNSFGFSLDAFGAEVDARLLALRSQQRNHLAANENLVDVSDEEGRAAITNKRMRETFERYKKKVSPKAFVRSRTGATVFFDDRAEALPLALEQCKTVAPLGCRVVAIDDRYVTSQSGVPADIDLRLASTGDDAWTNEVRSRWMPVLRNTVDHFNKVVQTRFGHYLREPIRIHVVANREDYAKVLRGDMNLSSGGAQRTAESSSGFANQNGQMLISMYHRPDPESLWEVAVTISLHELVHELQGQLRGDGSGFKPVRWLDEATADQIANLVGKELVLDKSAKFALSDWREHVIEWYRLKGKSITKPEEVLDVDFNQWLSLIRNGKNPYQMSGIMAAHLADKVGANYFPSLLNYWELAAREGETEEKAFEKSFGFSKTEFMRSLKTWLATL